MGQTDLPTQDSFRCISTTCTLDVGPLATLQKWEWKLSGNLMGTKEFDGLLMRTRGIWWELFGNLMRTKGFWLDIDENKRNWIGTVWELDGKSSIHLFKNIINMPWGHVCTTQLAHTPSKNKNKKHPWGHVGAIQLALLTRFILMCLFRVG